MLLVVGRAVPASAAGTASVTTDGFLASMTDVVPMSESRDNRLILASEAASATSTEVLPVTISGTFWLVAVDCAGTSVGLSSVTMLLLT